MDEGEARELLLLSGRRLANEARRLQEAATETTERLALMVEQWGEVAGELVKNYAEFGRYTYDMSDHPPLHDQEILLGKLLDNLRFAFRKGYRCGREGESSC